MTSRRFVQSEQADPHLLAKETTFLNPLRSSALPFPIFASAFKLDSHNLNPRCPHWMQCWTVKRIPTIHRLFSEPIVFHPLVSLAMYSIAHLLLDEWHLRGDDLGFIENTVDNTYRKIPFGPVTTATASKYAAHCDKVNRRYPLQKIVFVRRCPRQTIASERREMIY